jgi:DNA-binding NarL/FixJ family response regulator
VPGEIRILFVDDNQDLTDVLERLVAHESDLEHVGTLHDAKPLLSAVAELHPDVALVDLTMKGKPPLQAVREVVQQQSPVRILVYSGRDDLAVVDEVLDAGAWGFVSKHCSPESVLDAIRRVARGETVIEHPR